MPTYTFSCTTCKNGFDYALTFKEYDNFKDQGKDQLKVKCPKCQLYNGIIRTYAGAPGIKFGKGFFKDGYESAKNVTRDDD
jgi:predicted nucleic acid-binding Zn ribbon protein